MCNWICYSQNKILKPITVTSFIKQSRIVINTSNGIITVDLHLSVDTQHFRVMLYR